ncbi:unnamed protein product [Boreogadus saida]
MCRHNKPCTEGFSYICRSDVISGLLLFFLSPCIPIQCEGTVRSMGGGTYTVGPPNSWMLPMPNYLSQVIIKLNGLPQQAPRTTASVAIVAIATLAAIAAITPSS